LDGTNTLATGTAICRPTISTAGKYDIYLWYPSGFNRATNAPWFISFNEGSTTSHVNQQTNGGGWFLIAGAIDFAEGTNGYIQLSNDIGVTNKVVIADAVKFVYAFGPVIISQPQSQTVAAGQIASFSVSGYGSAPLIYQWMKDDADILNATNSTLIFTNAQTNDSAQYKVVVSNTLTNVSSDSALLSVIQLKINSFTLASDNRVQFQMNFAPPNIEFEASSNLTNWVTLSNAIHINDCFETPDTITNSPHRFYRAKLP